MKPSPDSNDSGMILVTAMLTLLVIMGLAALSSDTEPKPQPITQEVQLECFVFEDGWELVSAHYVHNHANAEFVCEKDGQYSICQPILVECSE